MDKHLENIITNNYKNFEKHFDNNQKLQFVKELKEKSGNSLKSCKELADYFWIHKKEFYSLNLIKKRNLKLRLLEMNFISSKMCLVKNTGLNGNLFGGEMLSWMDEIAAIYAYKRIESGNLVTLRYGETVFKKPVKQGDIVHFYCGKDKYTDSSITFNIESYVNDELVFSTDTTFVCVDEYGNKKNIKIK